MNQINLKSTRKNYFWQSFLIAFYIFGLVISTTFIVPDFFSNNSVRPDGLLNNYWNYLVKDLIGGLANGVTTWDKTAAVLFIIISLTGNLFAFAFIFWFARSFILAFTYKKWIKKYSTLAAEIINSVDITRHNPKVAMIVYVCNDLTPSTILQTANQTYKNIDVWLLDDSSKPEAIELVKKFASEHNFKICPRPVEHKKAHPTMIGNMFYFLSQHAKEYDFIFETGTSTITTNTFVENSLKYFYSPLINSKNVGAVSGCGAFYPSRNIFSYIAGISLQWGDANLNGAGFRSSGTQMYVNGWAAVYKSSVLASIPLEDIECPSCDVARSFWMAQKGIDTCFNPFDFSGKLNTQNIYRFKNQRLKWVGGDSFIFKKYWTKHYPDKEVNKFVKLHLFEIIINYIVGLICAILTVILLAACPRLTSTLFNKGAMITAIILGSGLGLFILIALIIYRPNIRVLLLTLVSSLFEFAIIFRKWSQMLFIGLIMGKWSSKSVTIKTTEKMSAKQLLKICRWDFGVILVTITVCLLLHFFCPQIPSSVVWGGLFGIFTAPSIIWILSALLTYIPYKKGWDDSVDNYDIARNDYRFTYIKETEIWKKQHPEH